MMIKDGFFDSLFVKNNQNNIDSINLKARKVIRLDNPLLPKSVPVERKELWYDPFPKE